MTAPFPGSLTIKMNGGPKFDGLGYGPFIDDPSKPWGLILHTTETAGVPGYGSGVHPHFTYDAPRRKWIQHVRLDRRAGTLKGSSTIESGKKVPTNAAKVIQVEIVCYSSKSIADKYGRLWVGHLSPEQKQDIADFILWLHGEKGIALKWYPKVGVTGSKAMSHDEWWHNRAASGWGIAEHATAADSSTHWDCGAIDREAIMSLVLNEAPPTGPPPPDIEPAWPLLLRKSDTHPKVKVLRGALYGLGYMLFSYSPGHRFTEAVDKAVRAFQADARITVDGIVGPATRSALEVAMARSLR